MSEWHKGPLFVDVGAKGVRVSVVFTWDLPIAADMVEKAIAFGYPIRVGGPAVRLMPDYLGNYSTTLDDGDWLSRHNPQATRTSFGCPLKCEFCAVPKLHTMTEIPDFRPAPLVCDDNFLATSKAHILRSVDRLKGVKGVDFNQGLEARLFRGWRVDALRSMDVRIFRFAWDDEHSERSVMDAVRRAKAAGIPKRAIRCYVLVGFKESPDEAMYRMRTLHAEGVWPFPMRYQPLDSLQKNKHVPEQWDEAELRRFVRYWARMRFHRKIPYEEFGSAQRAEARRQGPPLFPLDPPPPDAL